MAILTVSSSPRFRLMRNDTPETPFFVQYKGLISEAWQTAYQTNHEYKAVRYYTAMVEGKSPNDAWLLTKQKEYRE